MALGPGWEAPTLVSLLVRLGITGVAFAVAVSILAGMDVTGGFSSYLKIAIVFGVLNAIVGTVLRILTIPLKLLNSVCSQSS